MDNNLPALTALVTAAPADHERRSTGAGTGKGSADSGGNGDGFGASLRRALDSGESRANAASSRDAADAADTAAAPTSDDDAGYDPATMPVDPAAHQDDALTLLAGQLTQPAPLIVPTPSTDPTAPALTTDAAAVGAYGEEFAPLSLPGASTATPGKSPTTRIQPEFAPVSEVAAMAVRITTRTVANPLANDRSATTAPVASAPGEAVATGVALPTAVPPALATATPLIKPGSAKPGAATATTTATTTAPTPAAEATVPPRSLAKPKVASESGDLTPAAVDPAPTRGDGAQATATEPAARGNPVERAIANQVERALLRTDHANGGRMLVLRITPPELGTVRIEVSERAGQLTARVYADDAAVRVAIERFLPQIRQDLRSYDAPIRDVVLADAWNRDTQHQPGGQRRQNRQSPGAEFGLSAVDALASASGAPYARALGGVIDADAVDARA